MSNFFIFHIIKILYNATKKAEEIGTMNTTLVLKASRNKTPLAALQTTFHKHRRQIDQLRSRLQKVKNECEKALAVYHSDLKPKEKTVGNLVTQFVLRLRDITKNPKHFNKRQKKTLQGIFQESIEIIFNTLEYDEIHREIKVIYEEIKGKSLDEDFQDQLSKLKEMIKENTGVSDVDLSDFNPEDSVEEVYIKMSQVFGKLKENAENSTSPPPPKQKSKKELMKEKKVQELQELQNKCLNSIYKRLVKELHPDLEQDLEKKAEKVVLMKRITVAYEQQDLISLLAVESEWFGKVDLGLESLDEKSFKAYNALLKDHIEELKEELLLAPQHPRYVDLQHCIQDCLDDPLRGIENALNECDDIITQYTIRLKDLCGKNPLQFLKAALDALEDISEIDDELLEMLCLKDF